MSLLAQKPPMGWNSWNTFGEHISEDLIKEMADVMARDYLKAGYEYLVIDDCWSLMERDEAGRLVADPKKFPHGMKAVADYVHSKGLKFGMYSCAGVRTCAGYPSSYDHEFVDAATFAGWGVDFLKYDFCNFPTTGDCRMRYQMMSMALKASGRDILFSACNWGVEEPWHWMRSVGTHMYRSTGDIQDNFVSFTDIVKSQLDKFCDSAPGCYNDIDMLTVGMYGKGNVGLGQPCNDSEYKMQFALWCMLSAPLMMGADLRNLSETAKALMLNQELIRINQDPECRPPIVVSKVSDWGESYVLFKHLADNEFALGLFNFSDKKRNVQAIFADFGLPESAGYGLELKDAFTGEEAGLCHDYLIRELESHDCTVLVGRMKAR